MTCEKCGSDDVQTRYHATHRECGYSSRAKQYDMGEHLHRTCRGCGFDWADAALAAAAPAPEHEAHDLAYRLAHWQLTDDEREEYEQRLRQLRSYPVPTPEPLPTTADPDLENITEKGRAPETSSE